MPEHELTEREMLIARKAAKLAVEEVTKEFYAQVGKGVVQRFLVILGAAVVGWLAARGYVSFK
jgi:hypothetical protein